MPHDSTPELRRVADALTRTPAPLTPLRLALAERAATTGANVVRASLPPLAGLTGAAAEATKAARPVRVAGEELLGSGLERIQPVLLTGASRVGGWPGRWRYGFRRWCPRRRSQA